MPLFFLMTLFICVITGYIFNKCSDEVGYLAGLFAIISLILSLILAPWEIQVTILVVVLVTTKKLLQGNQCRLKHEGGNNYPIVSQSKTAKREVNRQYRGVNYKVNIENSELIEEEVVGKYRGNAWIIHRMKSTVGKEKQSG